MKKTHRRNAGQGFQFNFHGAFNDKKAAMGKEQKTPGAFIKTFWYKSGPRYAVLTPAAKNPLSVPQKHQLKIARDTLRMADAMAGVMGMTKATARAIVRKLVRSGKAPSRMPRRVQTSANPRRGAKKKRNYASASDLYTKFHGRGPDKTLTELVPAGDPYAEHPELAEMGKLISLTVGEGLKLSGEHGNFARATGGEYWGPFVLDFKQNQPSVAGEPNGTQIYFVGGDQSLSEEKLRELGADPEKDLIDLGFCYRIEYFTRKKFDQFKPVDYWHLLGEETGVQPRLMYDRRHRLLQFVGGEYIIKPEGIVN